MPRYQFLAIDPDGRKKRGGLDAADETAARADLKRRKLLLVEIAPEESARPESTAARTGGRAKLTHKSRLLITRQLATLIDAAVPVDEALAMIAEQQESQTAQRAVRQVHASVLEGQRLADALTRQGAFPAIYCAAVAGGERSGRLGFVLNRLADYLDRAQAMRGKITTAMVYPLALTVVAIAVVSCLMIFVVPSLVEQFQHFDTQLPLLTRILIGVSTVLHDFWVLILVVLVSGGYAIHLVMKGEAARFAVDAATLRAPVIGRWAVAVNASRFVRGVSTLVAAGLPVLEAVRAARDGVGNRAVAKALGQMAGWIEEGVPLSQAMRRSGVVPPLVAYMTASGENAGELPSMLDKAADHLDQEFDTFTASALSLLEPAIIVFMGGVVASIVLAIMLPILQMNRLAIG